MPHASGFCCSNSNQRACSCLALTGTNALPSHDVCTSVKGPSPSRACATSASTQKAGNSQPPLGLLKKKPLARCTVKMDARRNDDDDIDTEQHHFPAQAMRQSLDREFRCGIGRQQRVAILAGHRADHHDPPRLSLQRRIGPEQRTESLRGDDRPDDVHIHLAAEFVGEKLEHRPRHRNAGIVDEATERLAAQRRARTSRATASTAASSVTPNNSGVKFAPISLLRRLASAGLRTLPNTRNPRSSKGFAVAQPMPVDAPVITTDCIGWLLLPSRKSVCPDRAQ